LQLSDRWVLKEKREKRKEKREKRKEKREKRKEKTDPFCKVFAGALLQDKSGNDTSLSGLVDVRDKFTAQDEMKRRGGSAQQQQKEKMSDRRKQTGASTHSRALACHAR